MQVSSGEVVHGGQGLDVITAELGREPLEALPRRAAGRQNVGPRPRNSRRGCPSRGSVSGWSGPCFALVSLRASSDSLIASGSRPPSAYAPARLPIVHNVSELSAPSAVLLCLSASSKSSRAGSYSAGVEIRQAEVVHRAQRVRVVGTELGFASASRFPRTAVWRVESICIAIRLCKVVHCSQGIRVVRAELDLQPLERLPRRAEGFAQTPGGAVCIGEVVD